MVYVIEQLENGKWIYRRNPKNGVVMFNNKRDAETMVRRLERVNRGPDMVEGYRYRKVVD